MLARLRNLGDSSIVSAERIPISDLSAYRKVWLLAADGRDVVPGDAGATCRGFGLPYPEPFSAVFAHAGRMWLQVGLQRWDLSSAVGIQQLSDRIADSSYLITFGDGQAAEITVHFPAEVARVRAADPTYDEIDSTSDDIMKLLPYRAVDGWTAGDGDVQAWAERIYALWSAVQR
jgi:hypothetical protein